MSKRCSSLGYDCAPSSSGYAISTQRDAGYYRAERGNTTCYTVTVCLHVHTPRIVSLAVRRRPILNPLPHLPAFRLSGGSATLDCRSILLLVV